MNRDSPWLLDPEVVFLNHGSFGACPRPVLRRQQDLRERLERQPVRFFVRELEDQLDQARESLARFLAARPEDLVWVPNATTGVNTVLRSFELEPGDELLVTDHAYNACRNALDDVASRSGARVVCVPIRFPLDDPDEVSRAVLGAVTAATRLALIDHVTSQTGLVLPAAALSRELVARNIDVLIDGAHAPGMLELDVPSIGATYYTGNCHKWICAPKGSGFLWIHADRQASVRPLVISHGANSSRRDRPRTHIEFDWVGTTDPTAFLCVPDALAFMESMLPGGWDELRRTNRSRVLAGRDALCRALDVDAPCPDSMIGSLAAVPLPPGRGPAPTSALYTDPLQDELLQRFKIEVPVIPWPRHPQRLVRISSQIYNDVEQYRLLAGALGSLGSEGRL